MTRPGSSTRKVTSLESSQLGDPSRCTFCLTKYLVIKVLPCKVVLVRAMTTVHLPYGPHHYVDWSMPTRYANSMSITDTRDHKISTPMYTLEELLVMRRPTINYDCHYGSLQRNWCGRVARPKHVSYPIGRGHIFVRGVRAGPILNCGRRLGKPNTSLKKGHRPPRILLLDHYILCPEK